MSFRHYFTASLATASQRPVLVRFRSRTPPLLRPFGYGAAPKLGSPDLSAPTPSGVRKGFLARPFAVTLQSRSVIASHKPATYRQRYDITYSQAPAVQKWTCLLFIRADGRYIALFQWDRDLLPSPCVHTQSGIFLIYRNMSPKGKGARPFNLKVWLSKTDGKEARAEYRANDTIFAQGDFADSVFYINKGKVKLTVVSKQGKEAVVAILKDGDFFGEGCLAGQQVRIATAVAIAECSVMKVQKAAVVSLLHDEPAFSDLFMAHLLSRNIKIEEDLIDQLFNSSEKRLARVLLLLANFGKEGHPELIIPKISQETLAGIVGTTRPRINFFMNRFRKLGFIEYNGGLKVHSSLLNVILHD